MWGMAVGTKMESWAIGKFQWGGGLRELGALVSSNAMVQNTVWTLMMVPHGSLTRVILTPSTSLGIASIVTGNMRTIVMVSRTEPAATAEPVTCRKVMVIVGMTGNAQGS